MAKEKESLPESRLTFEVTGAQTSGLVNLVLSRQTGFIECEHPLIDKPKVITEPAVARARMLGLGLKDILAPSYPASSFPLTSGRSSRQASMRSKGRRLEVRD